MVQDAAVDLRVAWVTGVMNDLGYSDRSETEPGLYVFDHPDPSKFPISWDSNTPGGTIGIQVDRAGISTEDFNRAVVANMPAGPYASPYDF